MNLPRLIVCLVLEIIGNRFRHRAWRLYQADNRHDQEEVRKVIQREKPGPDERVALRRLGAYIAQRQAIEEERPEKPAVNRAVTRGTDARGIEPGDEEE